jgi:fibronectin type 3 domain-containing protein
VNAVGEGGNSNQASTTTPTVPGAPQTLTAVAGVTQVTLNWQLPVSDGGSTITEYRIYRSTTDGGPYSFLNSTTNLTFIDTTVTNGQSYYYVVRAVNAVGEGGNSNQVSAFLELSSTTSSTIPITTTNDLISNIPFSEPSILLLSLIALVFIGKNRRKHKS